MGDIKKQKKKYSKPRHPWQKTRIESEKGLTKKYGFTNKKQIWKMNSTLLGYKDQLKSLFGRIDAQAETEKKQLFNKLESLGLIQEGATPDDVLGISFEQLLDRRLQTLVYKKNLARSPSQARQFITHGHIKIGEKTMTSPSYLVLVKEEPLIKFTEKSTLSNEEHPERKTPEKHGKEKKRKEKQEEEKALAFEEQEIKEVEE